MAREAVSLLEGGAEALDSGEEFREALALLHSSRDLGDGGALLAWVDLELESARRFAKTGERPFPFPPPFAAGTPRAAGTSAPPGAHPSHPDSALRGLPGGNSAPAQGTLAHPKGPVEMIAG